MRRTFLLVWLFIALGIGLNVRATYYFGSASAGGGTPAITTVNSGTSFKKGDSIVIVGTGFGASQGAGTVKIATSDSISSTTGFWPTYRSVSTVQATANGVGGNLTLTAPAGAAQNDVYIACIAYRGTASFTAPTGGEWTQIVQNNSGNTSATTNASIASGAMFWCRRGASDPNFVFQRTLGDVAMGQIVAFQNCVLTGDPIDTSSINTLGANSATVTTGALTTTVPRTRIVMAFAGADNTTASNYFGATGPYMLREWADSASTNDADTTLAISDREWFQTGSTGTLTCTAGNSSRHVAMACALKPITYTPIAQTVTAWSDTSITVTVVRNNGLDRGTRYVFVTNNSAATNAAGKAVTLTGIVRYVDAAAHTSGDGTTTGTGNGGVNSFATISEAITASVNTLTDIYEIHCVGSSADSGDLDHAPMAAADCTTSLDNYLYIDGGNTTGKYSTSLFRLTPAVNGSGIYNDGVSHFLIENLQMNITSTGTPNLNGMRASTENVAGYDSYLRFRNCIVQTNVSGGGNITAFSNSKLGTGGAGDGVVIMENCIAQGAGSDPAGNGYNTDAAADFITHINCIAYNIQYGWQDHATAINCGAFACTVAFVGGSSAYINRNNVSDDDSEIGSDQQTAGSPSFVSTAGTYDLHLQAGDTVMRNKVQAGNISWTRTLDIDGQGISSTNWDIGPDEQQ